MGMGHLTLGYNWRKWRFDRPNNGCGPNFVALADLALTHLIFGMLHFFFVTIWVGCEVPSCSAVEISLRALFTATLLSILNRMLSDSDSAGIEAAVRCHSCHMLDQPSLTKNQPWNQNTYGDRLETCDVKVLARIRNRKNLGHCF